MNAERPPDPANTLHAPSSTHLFDAARVSSQPYLYPHENSAADAPSAHSAWNGYPASEERQAPKGYTVFFDRWRHVKWRRTPKDKHVRNPISDNIRAELRRTYREGAIVIGLLVVAIGALALGQAGVDEWWLIAIFMVSVIALGTVNATHEYRRYIPSPKSARPPGERRRRRDQLRRAESMAALKRESAK